MSALQTTRRRPLPGWAIFAIAAVVAVTAGGLTGRVISHETSGTGPSDTVLRFFEAMRDNDAKTALSELATPPTDTTFITRETLAKGHESAAITEVNVPATSSTVVPVSYKLGGEIVTDRISVQPVGNTYKVSTSLNSGGIVLKGRTRTDLPLSVAGLPVRTETVVLLPGSYPLTTVTDHLRYGTGSLVVKRLSDTPSANDLRLELTETGRTAAARAVTSSLRACTGQKSFAPPGCPFKLAVTTADPSTVSWSLLSSPADDLRVTVSATEVTKSTVEVPLTLRISYVDGTSTVPQDLASVQAVGTIDLLAEPMTVTWTA
jgi:hypothetical protein